MEILFLFVLAAIWLIAASVWDLKKREVPNWLSFSLIIFALTYRAFFSAINSDFMFLIYGLAGFGLFVVLAYVFYYARVFAGGDAKLLMALGAILPFASSLYENLVIMLYFILMLLLIGGAYGLVYSAVLAFKSWKRFLKEFSEELKLKKNLMFISRSFAVLSFLLVIFMNEVFFFLFPVFFFILPYLLVYARAVERCCMIISVPGKDVTVGDWLNEEVIMGKKTIKPYWEGLSEKEVEIIKKHGKKVMIKQGIPFVPSFLMSFIIFFIIKEFFLELFLIF